MEENKDKKSEGSGKLQLKKTFNVGQIKQSFSHGRTRSVSVEIKKKRVLKGLDSKPELSEKEKITEKIEQHEEKQEEKKDVSKNNLQKQTFNKPQNNNSLKKRPSFKEDQNEKKISKKFTNSTNDTKTNNSPEKEEKFKTTKFTKVPKSFENRRQGKLTISQALNDDNEKVRSLAAVRRAREKAKLRNISTLENKDVFENKEKKTSLSLNLKDQPVKPLMRKDAVRLK